MMRESCASDSEALAAAQSRSIHEFSRADALAALDLHGFELQPRIPAANHLDTGIA